MIKKYRIVAETPPPFKTRTYVAENGEAVLYDTLADAEEAMRSMREGASPDVTFVSQEIEIEEPEDARNRRA